MTDATKIVKSGAQGSLAPLKNVYGIMELVTKLQDRGAHLPNIGVAYGFSGYGKTYGSVYVQNKTRAIRVEIGESWNRKTFVSAILRELGATDLRGATADLVQRVIAILGDEPDRPLIIDEADKLVDKGQIEIVREIAEHAQIPVLLVGEEALPQKLERYERVHNRVLGWFAAQPCDQQDCRLLAGIFLGKVEIDDLLLDDVRVKAEGRARRVVVTLSSMADFARAAGVRKLDRDSYKGEIFTGAAPKARGRVSFGGRTS